MPKAKKKDLDKMARIAATGTIRDALLAGGYSPQSAARGLAALPVGERAKFKQARQEYALKKLSKFEDLGKKVTAEQQENVVRGALLDNVAKGKDKATASLKMLGSDKRVAMFEPDNATGVIVINAVAIPPFDSVPRLPSEQPARQIEAQAPASLPSGGMNWDRNFDYKPPEQIKPPAEIIGSASGDGWQKAKGGKWHRQ